MHVRVKRCTRVTLPVFVTIVNPNYVRNFCIYKKILKTYRKTGLFDFKFGVLDLIYIKFILNLYDLC